MSNNATNITMDPITAIIIAAPSHRSAVCRIAAMMRKANPSISQSLAMRSAWTLVKTRRPATVVKGWIGFQGSSDLEIAHRRAKQFIAERKLAVDQRLIGPEEYWAAAA